MIHYADGRVVDANPAAAQILGVQPGVLTTLPPFPAEHVLHEDGSPFRAAELPLAVATRTGRAVRDVIAGVPYGGTGEIRWLQISAVPLDDDGGRPSREGHVFFRDITEERRRNQALREAGTLLQHLKDSNVLGVVAHAEEGAYDANDAFLHLIGASRDDLQAGRLTIRSVTAPGYAARDAAAIEQLRRDGIFRPYDKEYLHRLDGHRIPVLVTGVAISQQPLRWLTLVVDLTAPQRAQREHAELKAREQVARSQADYAQERLSVVLRAGAMVAAARDRQQMLEHAASLVVPTLADHCIVFLPTSDGMLRATFLAHKDPGRAPVLAGFKRQKIPAKGPMQTQIAYTTGTTQQLRDGRSRIREWRELPSAVTEMLIQLRAETILSIPLLIGGESAGVMTLARDADRELFSDTDIEVLEEFARRIAEGLATAETYAREHTIAEILQRSLLPGALPSFPGIDLAASYLPASDGVHVGGDWYDAFPLPGARVGLVIGDVTGHNITSAAVMGQVRSLLRAYALGADDPGEALQRTSDALAWLLPDALATAVYAVLDPVTGELAYASAGHPPPLVTSTAGKTGYLDDAAGTMLGAAPGTPQQTARVRLAPGSGLLLYTDGLIEDRCRDISDGLDTLAGTLRQAGTGTAQELCAAAEGVLAGMPSRADDVCLLALRRLPDRAPAGPREEVPAGYSRAR